MVQHTIRIREALMSDMPGLLAVRYAEQPALHRDRIMLSDQHTQQYYLAEIDDQIAGFSLLLLERPPNWTDTLNTFPVLIDVFVHESYRGHGVGQTLIQHMENIAGQHGKRNIYLSVEPETNPRAFALYCRLGYRALQTHPYRNVWHFVDSDGTLHEGEEWVIDMYKTLLPERSES